MGAIFKKEVKNYFLNPVGYVFFGIFFAISGILFFLNVIQIGIADVSGFFNSLFLTIIFSMPVLTMGIISDEYKFNTDVLLFSSPITNFSIVFGKYIAAVSIYCLAMLLDFLYILIVSFFTTIQLGLVLACAIGMILLGTSLISIGVFVSALTKNQVIAAFGAFGIFMLLTFVDEATKYIPFKWLQGVLSGVSIFPRYNNFISGILNISDVLYFLTIAVIFIFLAILVLEKKRWS